MPAIVSSVAFQFPTTLAIQGNLAEIKNAINALEPNELLVTPEGAISGYSQDSSFLSRIDISELEKAIATIQGWAVERRIHAVVGSAEFENGKWYNSAFYFGPSGERSVYRKINLAESERGYFTPGNNLPVFNISVCGKPVQLGIQMCREIRYPEQWRILAQKGAQVFAFLNNAVGDAAICPVWRSHLISRAAETQRYIVAANNAEPKQKCPTMIVAPDGTVLFETVSDRVATGRAQLNLSQIGDRVLNQARHDIVHITSLS